MGPANRTDLVMLSGKHPHEVPGSLGLKAQQPHVTRQSNARDLPIKQTEFGEVQQETPP